VKSGGCKSGKENTTSRRGRPPFWETCGSLEKKKRKEEKGITVFSKKEGQHKPVLSGKKKEEKRPFVKTIKKKKVSMPRKGEHGGKSFHGVNELERKNRRGKPRTKGRGGKKNPHGRKRKLERHAPKNERGKFCLKKRI